MFKNITKTIMMIAMCIVVTFVSCTKDAPLAETGVYRSKDLIVTNVQTEEGEKLQNFANENLRMQFIDGELEDSFDHVTVTNKKEYKERVAERFGIFAKGIDAQYLEPKTENFSETEGAKTELKTIQLDHNNGWVELKGGDVYSWHATNNDDATDCPYSYRDSVWTSGSTFTFVPADSLVNKGIRGYEVNFPGADVKVVEVEKKAEEVNGVVYNGKTWNALKVSYISDVTLTIPEEYRVKGGQYEMTKRITNVVFYLRHEVTTSLENLTYKVNILDGEYIRKEYQTVGFSLVTRDNGEVTDSKSYGVEENFSIKTNQVSDVEVFSEEALRNTDVTLTKGNITSETTNEDILVKTTYSFTDFGSTSDGSSFEVNGSYESNVWRNEEFPYAFVSDRSLIETSVKNEAESTVSRIVYDVTDTFTYNVAYNHSDKKGEPEVIVVTHKRFYNVPDNFQTTIEQTAYVADFTDNGNTKVTTKAQYNELTTTVTNNGVLVSSTSRKRNLNLEGEMSGSKEVTIVDAPTKAPSVSVVSRPNNTDWNDDKDEQGFRSKRTFETRGITISDGAKFELSYFFDKDTRNGVDTLDHTKIKGVRSATASMPVKVDSLSSKTKEVYGVVLTVVLDLESTATVQTKASGDNTLTLKASYNQVRTIDPEDEYVPGKDRTVWTVTPNGNGFDILGEHYETWTISGEIMTDTKSGRMSASNTGRDGGSHVVKNFEFVNNGKGHNGTGKGVYTSPASNGTDTIESLYDWSADASLTLTLSGKGGDGASKTFIGSFSLNEDGQNISASTTSNGYDVCTLVNGTNGVYTVEGKNVNLPASVSHELKVMRDEYVPGKDRTVWTVTPNGNGFDIKGQHYETWAISGEILTDTKSGRMSASNTGRDGGSHVVKNFGFVNNGKGHNGTGNGVYTSPASNGTDTIESLYDWSADASLTLTLSGKGGNGASKTFVGSFNLNEDGQSISNSTAANGYDVCTLVNKTKGVYTVEGKNVNLPASVSHELKVKREIPKTFPEEWGKCLGAGVSAVPAHWVASADMYQDGDGKQNAIKTMTFRFENGAVTVPFAGADDTSVAMPEISKVLSGNFVEGEYSAEYNSGYYQRGSQVWVPAIAVDRNGGISYSIPGHSGIRSIRQETLNQWNWRNKNYTTVVSGYTFKCTEDGELTITYNGEVVFEGR